ncbi:MAG: tripartite tricarboxylate transporter permease [Bacteroidota bacterium]|nr:tripartite tricarboxylate transporter permease [Kiloniellaceae bacterium]
MLDAIAGGFALFLDPTVLLLMLIAVPVGLVMGVLPGLSGLSALAILLPFVYGMEPLAGLTFLLSAHAVVCTGGSLTAIVLGIPGAPANAATVIDGVPLRDQGRHGEAIGAALAASGLGGVIGVVALVVFLPLLQPVVRLFGAPETFVLALLGVVCIAIIGREDPLRGLIAAALGMFLGAFGYQRISGEPRFWMDFDYLLDGFRLVPMILGLFAVPEIAGLRLDGQRKSHGPATLAALAEGAAAVFRRFALSLRSSLIGVLVGIVPGVGGETAPFLAYAAAKNHARGTVPLGQGAIEGVIAPECSNNAKEGGALLTTLALGLPGSAGMSVLLGGFLLLGLQPGPDFLNQHMDIAIGLAIALAAANLLAVVLMLACAPLMLRVLSVPPQLLSAGIMVFVVIGAYAVAREPLDVVAVFAFGLLGWFMKAYGYSRPALLLGFILAPLIETYLYIALRSYGPTFIVQPGVLAIAAFLVAGLLWSPLWRLLRRLVGGAV